MINPGIPGLLLLGFTSFDVFLIGLYLQGYNTGGIAQLFLQVSAILFWYTSTLQPNARANTLIYPKHRFYSTRDLQIVGQRGKFTNVKLLEY